MPRSTFGMFFVHLSWTHHGKTRVRHQFFEASSEGSLHKAQRQPMVISSLVKLKLRYPPLPPPPPSMSSIQIQLPPRKPQQKQSHHPLPITIKPNRENHKTFRPSRENHITIKPNKENYKTIRPKRAKRGIPITTTTSNILCLMDSLGLPVHTDIYVSLIKECTITRDSARAAELHAHISRSNLRLSLPLVNRILLMYVSCGCLEVARQLFDEMTNDDFNSWAIIIAGYVEIDDYEEALYLFADMLQRQNKENYVVEFVALAWILVWIFKACVRTTNVELGKQLHGWLLKMGYMANLHVGSSLINFYGKFNCPEGANFVFDQLPHHDTVTWTAKIVNSCNEEHFNEVINIFNEMGKAGIKKNPYTFSSVIRACGRLKDDNGHCGRQVHANAIKVGIDESSLFVQCGLVDMYGKYGLITDARRVFEMIGDDERNDACWNAMLTSYIQHGLCTEAIKFLYKMKKAGVQPPQSLLNEVRIACGSK